MTLCMNQDSRVSCGCEALVGHLGVLVAGLKSQAKEPQTDQTADSYAPSCFKEESWSLDFGLI